MPQYVVERHLPNFTGEMVAADAKRIPGEDKCYCLFEGDSAATVRQANERADLPMENISEALSVTTEEIT